MTVLSAQGRRNKEQGCFLHRQAPIGRLSASKEALRRRDLWAKAEEKGMDHRTRIPTIDRGATIIEASRLMHDAKADELAVTEQVDGHAVPAGVLRPRDIVVRVLGVGLDPGVITVGDIVWRSGAT